MTPARVMNAPHAGRDLITASRVSGTPAFNTAGEKVGHVQDLSIDKVSGRVVYALLSFGGFLGFGEKFQPLPWSALTYQPERGGYVVAIAKADLEKAPSFTAEELQNFGAGHQEQVDRYYYPLPMV